VNYVGELNLYYYPSFFKILDIFNLSSLSNDARGLIQTDVRDGIFDAINFINSRFRNLYHLKLAKSLLMDSHSLKPNDQPEEYTPKNIQKDLQKNIDQSIPNQTQIPAENREIIDEKKTKTIEETTPKNSAENTEIITKTEIVEEISNKDLNNNSENIFNAPQHPYLAPRYSDFYSPVYNPYQLIGNPSSYYLMHTFAIQDPVIEHPH
jgi:hypothetical protein